MKIIETKIKIRDLVENYSDDGDGGVYGYGGRLCIRPAYQREFVYKDKQRDQVIYSIQHQWPLGLIYWAKTGDGTYEVLDGQQRIISICQYLNKDYSINCRFFHNLTEEEKEQLLEYTIDVRICEGTEKEKLEWFRIINVAGAVLTEQELLNAAYTGKWLADAKTYFSKRNCVAGQMADGYIKGNPIRQEYLEKVLSWIADRDGLENGEEYMAVHQHDDDAGALWTYFDEVIGWAKRTFPCVRKGITDTQDWGILYNKYRNRTYNFNTLEAEMKKLLMDDDVTKSSGIIPYLLSDRTKHDEKYLSLRAFTPAQKLRAYERQGHKCPFCQKAGIETEYTFEEMQGDHIIPWSQGGHTTDDNLQMLCQKCNNTKGGN